MVNWLVNSLVGQLVRGLPTSRVQLSPWEIPHSEAFGQCLERRLNVAVDAVAEGGVVGQCLRSRRGDMLERESCKVSCNRPTLGTYLRMSALGNLLATPDSTEGCARMYIKQFDFCIDGVW